MIHLLVGPMGSGKSARLLQMINSYEGAVPWIVVATWAPDPGWSKIKSRNKQSYEAYGCPNPRVLRDYILADMMNHPAGTPLRLIIDEGHLLGRGLYEVVREADRIPGSYIYVSGLLSDYQGNVFEDMARLAGGTTDIWMSHRECEVDGCENIATDSVRLTDEEDRVVLGKEKYRAYCPLHADIHRRR